MFFKLYINKMIFEYLTIGLSCLCLYLMTFKCLIEVTRARDKNDKADKNDNVEQKAEQIK